MTEKQIIRKIRNRSLKNFFLKNEMLQALLGNLIILALMYYFIDNWRGMKYIFGAYSIVVAMNVGIVIKLFFQKMTRKESSSSIINEMINTRRALEKKVSALDHSIKIMEKRELKESEIADLEADMKNLQTEIKDLQVT